MMNEQKALEWIADIFEESANEIHPETPRENIPAWDSLGVLTLMAALDEDLDIQLSDDEIRDLQSVKDILALLKRHGKLNGTGDR